MKRKFSLTTLGLFFGFLFYNNSFVCQSEREKTMTEKPIVQKKDINVVKETYVNGIMALKGVVGVYVGALDDGSLCIVVMVIKKTTELEEKIPKTLEGYTVRIDETGEIKPMK